MRLRCANSFSSDVFGNGALLEQINAKCSFAHSRCNEIRLVGIGAILFPSSLENGDTRCKRSVRNKGPDRAGRRNLPETHCGRTVDTRRARLSKMRFAPRFVVARIIAQPSQSQRVLIIQPDEPDPAIRFF